MISLRGLKVLGICLSFSLLTCCTSASDADRGGFKANGANEIVYPDQNWDAADSLWFYNTTQGSNLMYYDIFLHLEQANNEHPFRNKANMEKYRYLTQEASSDNPDALPIGWVKNSYEGEDYIGFTCAVCHTSQINSQMESTKYGIRIDGGPAMADVETMMLELETAMEASLSTANKEKFDRLADNILKDGKTDQNKMTKLRDRLTENYERMKCFNEMDTPKHRYGYARLDAFGRILNRVNSALNPPCTQVGPKPANAPVSYPFLWDTPQSDFVQWNGSVDNSGFGPLGRNTGEVLGVFAHFDLQEDLSTVSSAKTRNQVKLEGQIESLWSPSWEELAEKDYLKPLDEDSVERGKEVFKRYQCESCHMHIVDRKDEDRRVIVQMASLRMIGTDPTMIKNVAGYCIEKEKIPLNHALTFPCLHDQTNPNKVFGPTGLRAIGTSIVEEGGIPKLIWLAWWKCFVNPINKTVWYKCLLNLNPKDETVRHVDFEAVNKKNVGTLNAYKGRSLNGIWATAPYLHNGSVPNLHELFLPSECKPDDEQGKTCRSKIFTVGSLDFNPDKVGFEPPEGSTQVGLFQFDTTLPGNSNKGHEYAVGVTPIIVRDKNGVAVRNSDGTFETKTFENDKITDKERWDLIEYLKTL